MIDTRLARKRSLFPAHRAWGRKPLAQVIAIALAAAGSPAWAGPGGEQVIAGGAVITRPDAGSTLIRQTTQKAAINWQNFDIGAAESVRFDQPSSSSAVLNRVLGQAPTEILGALTANGQVFVLNPSGVFFGAGAQVNVGGLVAATLSLGTDDFMAGRLQFAGDGANGEVKNAGRIDAGGAVVLAGQRVTNAGVIVASGVALAAGDKVDLQLDGNRLVSIKVDKGAVDALADNRGLIRADGGQVLLTAKAADQLIRAVVNNSGVVEAATLRNVNGRIRLEGDIVGNNGTLSANGADGQRGGEIAIAAASDATLAAGSVITANGAQGGEIGVQARQGTVIADGRIEAVGNGGSGGKVVLVGDRVALVDGATVDVSGATAGGTALIGGDYQGGNTTVQNAERTYVAASATIRADALDKGNGGKVVVWADGDTRYRGTISARGGAAGGNGGLVEVSGKRDLEMIGRIAVDAPRGIGGKVLLDPQNIVLNNSTQASPPNNGNGTPDVAFADTPATGNYTIQIADVTGYNELYLQATNNITLSSALAMTSGNSVRFEAGNAIAINAALTASGGVDLSAATITSTTAGSITTTGAANNNAGTISIDATGAVNLAGNLAASGGTAAAGNPGRNGGTISIAGVGVALGAATVTASGSAGSGAGQAGGAGGTITIASTNGISGTGAMTASGGNGGTGPSAGGAAGSIALTNNNAGNIAVGALSARSGNALTTGAGGAAGSIAVTNNAPGGSLGTGALTTTGGNNGHGGTVSINAAGAVTTGLIATGGGAANTGTAGRNAGAVTLAGSSISTGANSITASGSAGLGASQSGGNGADVQITSIGAITTGAISTAGGAGITALANGGSAGSIIVTNNSTTTGAIALGALSSNSGAAFTTGTGGLTGAVQITNLAAGQGLSTGAITANGGTNSNGANVALTSQGNVAVTGLITTSGGARGTGNTGAGTRAGTITISGVDRSVTGAITAIGGAGLGTNQAGGNAGAVSIAGTGALTTVAISSQTGAATGTGAGGIAGGITLTGSNIGAGALTTTGGSNAHGGLVLADATGTLATGAIATGAGTANAGTSGRNAGGITLSADGAITGIGTITASGSAGVATGDQAGGNGAVVSITGGGGVTTAAITANGGAAAGTNAAGGNAGMIAIDNSGAGAISTGAMTAQTGAALGSGAGGTAGFIAVVNTAAGGNLTTAGITTTGGTKGHGGSIGLSALGAVSTGAAGNINSAGGATVTGNAGRNAGTITLSGGSVSTGTITATGSAGIGANQGGGNGADAQIASTGSITTGAINTAGGAGITPLANGGNAGSITVANNSTTTGAIALGALTSNSGAAFGTGAGGIAGAVQITNLAAGQSLSTGAIAANGGTNSNGANVALAAQGNVTVTGLINTSGGARGTGVTAAGTSAGTVTITGTNRSITGAITATGGAGLGTNQAGGNAGAVSIAGSGTLATGAISSQSGAATGTGAGGTAGGIALTGSSIGTGALTTTGGANGTGGNISATSSVGNLTVGAIAASGGTASTNTAGRNAGTITLDSAGQLTATTIAATGSAGNGASRAGGAGGAVALKAAGAIAVAAITTSGGNAGASGNANGGAGGSITLDAGGATPSISLGGNIAALGGNRVGTGVAGAGGGFWAKDATTNTASVTINTAGGTVGGAGGNIRFDGALNEDATARTLTLTAGTGTIALAGGAPTSALTTLAATGSAIALGSVQTKGAQSYTGATSLNGVLATIGTAGADTITFNSPVTLTGNSSIATAGGSGDNISIAQTINGNYALALDAGALGTISTSAVIGGSAALASFSASGAAVTFGRSVTAGSIFARSGSGNITLNTVGTVLKGTGTGNSVELVVAGAAGRFINNVGAGAIDASNAAGRFLVWSQDPASDTRGGLGFGFKQYGATYGVVPVADSNANNNGFLHAVAPVISASLTGSVAKTYDGTDTATLAAGNYSFSGAIDGDTVVVGYPTAAIYADKHAGSAKAVTASGLEIDSASNGVTTVYGYTLASTSATANIGIIDRRALVVNAVADSRTYDGSVVSGAAPTHAALQSGDSADFSQSFDTRHVGSGKALTASGVVDDGNGGANYSYTFNASHAGEITPAALTVTAQSDSRGYDGTTASVIGSVISGTIYDSIATAATQQFIDKNAGSNKTLKASGLVIDDGNGGNNYSIAYVADHSGEISRAALTVTAQTDSRGYSGTTASTVGPVVGGTIYDSIATAATQQFTDKSAGSNKTLNASGLVIDDGNGGDNYSISYVASNAGAIAKAALTVTAQTDSRGYNGTTTSTVGPVVGGTIYDSIVSAATQQFTDKNAGSNKTLNASGLVIDDGNNGDNYSISYVANTSGAIAKAALTVTAQADSRGYDGTTASTVGPVVSGTIYDSVVAAAAQQFTDKNAGINKTLNASGLVIDDGNNGDNYSISYVANNAGAIAKAALTVTAQADSRVYDGTAASALVPIVSGTLYDNVITAATQQFVNKNAGSNKALNASGLVIDDGNDGNNYAISYVSNHNGAIGKAALSLNAISDTKVYDATVASNGGVTVAGLQGGDTVTGAMQQFASKNARGTDGSTLQVAGYTLNDGNGGGNYDVAVGTATGTITRATISGVTGIVARDKVYDATTDAALDIGGAVVHGVLGADAVTVGAATGRFSDRNAGVGKAVGISAIALTGVDAGNYLLANNAAASSASILRREIVVAADSASKIYGERDPVTDFRVGGAGLAGGETIADVFIGALARDAGENVTGGPYSIRQGTLAVNDNYSIRSFAPGALTITLRSLTITADDKTCGVSTPLPPLTATYKGFAFADNPSSLEGLRVMNTVADPMASPGAYAITPSGQSSGNYAITYVGGTLLVTPGRAQAMDVVLPVIYSASDWSPGMADMKSAERNRKTTADCGTPGASQGDSAGCTAGGSDAGPEPQLGSIGDSARPTFGFAL